MGRGRINRDFGSVIAQKGGEGDGFGWGGGGEDV